MAKIISFDIWDTIIKRKCHPEEIKLHTANYIVLNYEKNLKEKYKNIYEILKVRDEIEAQECEKNKKAGNDDECKIIEVFKLLQKEIMKEEFQDISEELLRVEIEQEKRCIFINPEILPIFEKYKDLKMYCISDFYMGAEELKELLDYLKIPVKIEKIYSSADYLLNKRTGNLYKKAEEEIGVKPEEHIHVGDNQYSDIENAKKIGITAIKTTKTEFDFIPEKGRKFQLDLAKIKKDTKSKENKLFNCGVDLAPILYFFGYDIIEYAIKNKIEKVYYQTREGETFIKIHKMIQENNPFGVKIPECDIIEVSRVATFSASLKEFSISELMRIWSQYKYELGMNMKELFRSMDIEIAPYEKYMKKHGINIEELMYEPWFDLKIIELCEDKEFTASIQKELDEKRKELIEYFEKQKGIINDEKSLFVVDIGWRGTIQDNLCYIFTNKMIGGYYIALYDYFNPQPKNSYKVSFIENKDIRDNEVNSMITLLEWIFNPGTGSTTGYKNGVAIRKAKDKEKDVVKKYIEPLQEGMFAGAEKINEYMKYHPYQSDEVVEEVYNVLRKTKKHPSKELIEAYYGMVFKDTFGATGTEEYIEKEQRLKLTIRLNPLKCRMILRDEPWKEAFLVYNHVEYMQYLLDFKSMIRKLLGKGN